MKEGEGRSAFQAEAEQSVQKRRNKRDMVTSMEMRVVQNSRCVVGSRGRARQLRVEMQAGTVHEVFFSHLLLLALKELNVLKI